MVASSETAARSLVEQARRKQELQKRIRHASEYIDLLQFRLKQLFAKLESLAKMPNMMPRTIVKHGFSLDVRAPGIRWKAILAAWQELYAALKQLELAAVKNVPEPESVEELASLVKAKYAAFHHTAEEHLQEFATLLAEYPALIDAETFWGYFYMLINSTDQDFRALGALVDEICALAQGV